jgi:pullulanase
MTRQLSGARWETKASGLVALSSDWTGPGAPPLSLNPPARLVSLELADPRLWALRSGYWLEAGFVHFFCWKALLPDGVGEGLRVAGPFNDWGAREPGRWTLSAVCAQGAEGFELAVPLAEVLGGSATTAFKFVRADGRWLEPPFDADNISRDDDGHRNLMLSVDRTGRHFYRFVAVDVDPAAAPVRLIYTKPDELELCDILASDPLDVLEPPGPFGAVVGPAGTSFRVFAPRARAVEVSWRRPEEGIYHLLALKPAGQGAWVGELADSLTGAYYTLSIRGADEIGEARFSERPFVDPWARAQTDETPPAGIVLGPEDLRPLADGFIPPAVEDLVIVEGHLRDLLGLSGADPTCGGYRDLAAWIRSQGNYLRSLGVNAVELLPCAEFEHRSVEEYHWGYMPITAFGVANSYASAPGAVALAEFQDVVRACHEAGLAVILDVVLNHFGSPNGLMALDREYYFRTDPQGRLSNWSGCGNDVRAEAPLFQRLVRESLTHWTEVLGVDGVRLDLAELLGTPLLREIEADFRARAPHKILIAEPWSFRGHVARDLDGSTWTSWDDAFREFLPAYVRGHARSSDLLHHLAGCAGRPSARLRYAQSHDDMAWLDRITERPANDPLDPAPADVLRTRLMHAILLCSVGVPMLSAGQDFLATKRGVANTWRHGELNRLAPARWERFRSEHEWVARLIGWRLSAAGAVLRPRSVVSPGWMQVARDDAGEAFAAVLNADGAMGPSRLLLACNPHDRPVRLALPQAGPWHPVVLSPFPSCPHAPGAIPVLGTDTLDLPPLGCGVWSIGG